jgi:uncharacterized membrane protein
VNYLAAGALFFFCYPIIVGLFFSRRGSKNDAIEAELASLRRQMADVTARLKKAEFAASAAAGEQRSPTVEKVQPAVTPQAARPPQVAPPVASEASAAAHVKPALSDAAAAAKAAATKAPAASEGISAFRARGARRNPEDGSWIASHDEVSSKPPKPPAPPPAWLVAIKQWLFSGNMVAKFGLLILFIGVGFLLKYAAERVTVPIEVRLAAVVLADMALLAFGWRIRATRRAIGLPVQGAALAILMLTVFGAFQRYQLIPASMAFALLFILTAFTCSLAVLQNAVWLAVFGIAGGFAAPIMISTGEGNHIALFSYYALLNAGILAIAIKRSWRMLNLLGFVFTFIIGTGWGVLRYSPENYLSAQGFLIVYFLFYVGLAVAHAARQAPLMKEYVDATLVFATPVLAIGLQYALVRDKQFGMALSALALGLFYAGLAIVLWRRRGANWKLLTDSFLAMGVVFGTLALPFALDQRWTSGAWALEGAGIVWIGLRQKRVLTWMFGLLVQAGAWISFIAALAGIDIGTAANSNVWLGFLLLAGAAFAMAMNFRSQVDSRGFLRTANVFLALAALWLLGGAWAEVIINAERLDAILGTLLVSSAMATAVVLALLARRMRWPVARAFSLCAQLLGGAAMLYLALFHWSSILGAERMLAGALMICAGALFSGWTAHRTLADRRGRWLAASLLGWGACWWFGPVLVTVADWAAPLVQVFTVIDHYLIGTVLSALTFARAATRFDWPAMRFVSASSWVALTVGTCGLLQLLYGHSAWLPGVPVWLTYAVLWTTGEYLLTYWAACGWAMHGRVLKLLHLVRTVGPWMLIWPVASRSINTWLFGMPDEQQDLLASAGWHVSGDWARYITVWLMMAALFWLAGRSRSERWPARPVAAWYRNVLIPIGTTWALIVTAVWNLQQDGAMAPLPYLPVLNPLDLTTGFAALLAIICYRTRGADAAAPAKLPTVAKFAAYAWFNLMLLRTAAQVLGIDYHVDALAASQVVQSMLSLTWCVTALIVMRRAGRREDRATRLRQWLTGAALLAVVVAKLFIADLSNVGSMARIVSFVGVGVLMLIIGYLAPFPAADAAPAPEPASVPA